MSSSSTINTERRRTLLAQITYLTTQGQIQWARQTNSAHRYARWKNNLLILGPDLSLQTDKMPRYLFITPVDSPDYIEINSDDAELGHAVLALIQTVEAATAGKASVDPFELNEELLARLMNDQ